MDKFDGPWSWQQMGKICRTTRKLQGTWELGCGTSSLSNFENLMLQYNSIISISIRIGIISISLLIVIVSPFITRLTTYHVYVTKYILMCLSNIYLITYFRFRCSLKIYVAIVLFLCNT